MAVSGAGWRLSAGLWLHAGPSWGVLPTLLCLLQTSAHPQGGCPGSHPRHHLCHLHISGMSVLTQTSISFTSTWNQPNLWAVSHQEGQGNSFRLDEKCQLDNVTQLQQWFSPRNLRPTSYCPWCSYKTSGWLCHILHLFWAIGSNMGQGLHFSSPSQGHMEGHIYTYGQIRTITWEDLGPSFHSVAPGPVTDSCS